MVIEAVRTGILDKPYTRLLHAFGLPNTNGTFSSYMRTPDTNLTSPLRLMDYASQMALKESEHPIIGYTSAWAAASAALHHSPRGSEFSYADRRKALQSAGEMWQRTERQLEVASESETGERKARLLDLSYRSGEAKACLPNMYLAAQWFSGAEMPEFDIEIAHLQTKANLLALLTRMEKSNDTAPGTKPVSQIGMRIDNLQNEIVSILLPQEDLRQQVIVFPATFQQDHNIIPSLRADLVAVDTGLGHDSGLIQVTSDFKIKRGASYTRMYVRTEKDLVFDDGDLPNETAAAYLARENGDLHDIHNRRRLIEISIDLSDRMRNFIRDLNANQFPTQQASFAHR